MSEEEYNVRDVSVAQRQIHILSLLSSNPQGFTIVELVEKLKRWDIEVSKRTVTRDIDELSESYCICEEERNGKSYFMADQYNLKNIDLTISDMVSLTFMKELLGMYENTEVGENASAIIDKIIGNTAQLNKMHLEELKKLVRIADIKKDKNIDVDPTIEKVVSSAIDKRCKINIEYQGFNSEDKTERLICPYAIIFINGYMNVEAYCELRKEVRNFRISRIAKVTATDNTFKVPEEYFQHQGEGRFIHLSGKDKELIVIKFDEETGRFIQEYDSQMADKIVKVEDGILFERNTAITSEVVKWILGYGAGATVIQPESLKIMIKQEIVKMNQLY